MKNLYSVLSIGFAAIIGGAINYLYHPLMIRYLSIGEFAEFESLVGTLNILGVLTSGIGLFLVKEIAKNSGDLSVVKTIFRFSHKILFFAGCAAYLAFAAMSPFIAGFLKLESPVPVLVVGIAILFSFQGTVVGAVLHGLKKFGYIAASGVLSSVFRLILGLSFVSLGFGMLGAVGGFVATGAIMFFLNFLIVRNELKGFEDRYPVEDLKSGFRKNFDHIAHFFLLTLFLSILMNLDIIFAKNLFDAETAGTYAGISVVAKFLIFLGGSVETVYYPQIMERKKESVPRHFLVNSFGMLLLLAASAVAFNGFFGAYVLELMHAGFGRHVDIFLLLLVFGWLYAVISLFSKILIGWKAYGINYVFGALLLALFAFLTFSEHLTMAEFVWAFVAFAIAMAFACGWLVLRNLRKNGNLTHDTDTFLSNP